MLIDLNLVDVDSAKKYDVCIAGSGPAGITLARTLAARGKSVAIFEGGGLDYSQQSQDIYKGKCTESVGLEYWDNLTNCRLRYLGGTSNHWTGLCGLYDDADLSREMNGLPAWPITRDEMFTHFDEAKVILDLPKDAFEEKKHWNGQDFVFYNYSMSPPTRFKTKYLDELTKSNRIDLYINASLTNIKLDKVLDTVSGFEITNLKLKKFNFLAKEYVLAMGAVENARLLLASNQQIENGIGNQNDMVGRCFMEHLNINYGRFIAEPNQVWAINQNSIDIRPTAKFVKQNNIATGVITYTANKTIEDAGRTKALKKQLRTIVCKSETATEFARKLKDFHCDGDGFISSMLGQSPNVNSRITLDSDLDRFGMRRVKLDWQINDFDLNTIRTIGLASAKEMARLGYARVQLAKPILNKSVNMDEIGGHCHQMGTTRMSANPKFGVVDKNSKVHGMKNLYVAGSSVYSTGSFCNPTFTLVMLSLRLGHHLLRT